MNSSGLSLDYKWIFKFNYKSLALIALALFYNPFTPVEQKWLTTFGITLDPPQHLLDNFQKEAVFVFKGWLPLPVCAFECLDCLCICLFWLSVYLSVLTVCMKLYLSVLTSCLFFFLDSLSMCLSWLSVYLSVLTVCVFFCLDCLCICLSWMSLYSSV